MVAGLAANTVDGFSTSSTGKLVLMAAAATLAAETTDNLAAMIAAALFGRSVRETASRIIPVSVTSILICAPVAALLAVAHEALSGWTAGLFLLPGLAFQRVFTLYQRQGSLLEELAVTNESLSAANQSLRKTNLSFATALVQTLEESDRYTAGHSRAVATYARDIATQMGLGQFVAERLYLCGLVHDIGKIGLPPAILNKEGRLTLDERHQMERHSEIGERILSKVDAYADVAVVVRHHHERFDGEGYPDRIRGEDIPLESRIIAVADAYNAMTSDRPYRNAMSYEIARDRLIQAMGSQFFAEPVVAFIAILSTAEDAYRYGKSSAFGPIDPSQVSHTSRSSVFSAASGL